MKIALLTCTKFPQLILTDQKLIPAFLKFGIEAEAVIWNDQNVNWAEYDALIFRNTWDYYLMNDDFDAWLDKIDILGIQTFNSTNVVRKNKHKFYLRDMEKAGITIIPSVFIPKTNQLDLQKLISSAWKKVILKPAISAGSYLTKLFEFGDIDVVAKQYGPIAVQNDLILQKFIPEILTEGEISLIFFNKIFSHAVRKTPKAGDFRIQSQFGGIYEAFEADDKLISISKAIVEYVPEDLLYARVDGIMIAGIFHLMELELIEPDLFFDFVDHGQEKLVNAWMEINT